jgi:hypothetical protein
MAVSLEARTKQRALLGVICAGTAALILVGRGAPPIVFIAVVAGTFAAYGALVWSLAHRQISGRALICACVGLTIVAIAVPVRSSKDVYAYIMYGRIVAQHHASPYMHVPSEYPNDPALQRVQDSFRNTSSVYGPVFTGVSAAGMSVCGSSPVCGRMFFQTLEALAVLAAAWLVLRATGSWAAAACVGLNPVMLVGVVNGAHPDGLVATGLLAAVLIARERPVLAGILLGIATLIKVNVLLPGVVLIAWLFFREDKRKALTVGFTTAGLVVAGYIIAGGPRALKPLHQASLLVSHHSVWYPVTRWITNALTRNGWSPARAADYTAHLVPVLGLIIVVVISLLVAGGRARDSGPVPVVAAALTVYVLVSPYVLPWYTAPLIALLALRWRSRTTWLVLAFSALLFVAYPSHYPVHRTFMGLILPTTAFSILPVVEVLLLITIAVAAWRPRKTTRRAALVAEPT